MSLYAVDISNHQADLAAGDLPVDAIIIKATEGLAFVDPICDRHYQTAKDAGKLVGVYHFAGSSVTETLHNPSAEAQFFLDNTRGYHHDALLVLDFEPHDYMPADPVEWAAAFTTYVHDHIGVWPVIYLSASLANEWDWTPVAANCGLWVAGGRLYADNSYKIGDLPLETVPDVPGYWHMVGWQFSDRPIDLNEFYLTKDQWAAYANPTGVATAAQPAPTPVVVPDPVIPAPSPAVVGHTVEVGDTLCGIAVAYGTTLTEIVSMNPQIWDPNKIYVGDVIRVPATQIYIVAPGDTLTGIAEAFSTTVETLVELNCIDNPDLIFPGQELKVYA